MIGAILKLTKGSLPAIISVCELWDFYQHQNEDNKDEETLLKIFERLEIFGEDIHRFHRFVCNNSSKDCIHVLMALDKGLFNLSEIKDLISQSKRLDIKKMHTSTKLLRENDDEIAAVKAIDIRVRV